MFAWAGSSQASVLALRHSQRRINASGTHSVVSMALFLIS
jgi:hypothetical protein